MEQRIEFLVRLKQKEAPLAQLCREYGISRQTGYTWWRRLEEGGSFTELREHSRRPTHSPRKTRGEVEARVLALRDHYGWGARKLQVLLAREGIRVEEWTLNRILHREGRCGKSPQARATLQRFAREAPNQLYQMDFKGEYRVREGWCYPLTLLDDHSRYLVGLWPLPSEKLEGVQAALEGLFREQGVPEAMLMDRGRPWWATTSGHGLTRLSVWLLKQDIELLYGRPYHPQTQGKAERLHRTLKERTRQEGVPPDLAAWGRWAVAFRGEYNAVRPHEALAMRTPGEVYTQANLRPYQERPAPYPYPRGAVRRLNTQGCLKWQGRLWFVCEALAKEEVGVEEIEDVVIVSYRATTIRELDLRTRTTRALVTRVRNPNVSGMSC